MLDATGEQGRGDSRRNIYGAEDVTTTPRTTPSALTVAWRYENSAAQVSALVGKQFLPRIRDLGRITLCGTGSRAEAAGRYPHAGPLLARRANMVLVTEHWDDPLRLAAPTGRPRRYLGVG